MNRDTVTGIAALAFVALGIISYFQNLTYGIAAAIFGLCVTVAIAKYAARLSVQSQLYESLFSERSRNFIGIDSSGRIVIGNPERQAKLNPGDIVSVDVKVNSSTVTKTNRASQLAGAAVGAAALGGIGLLLGGLTGSKTSRDMIETLSLEISTRNAAFPHLSIHLLPHGAKWKPDSITVQTAVETARHWMRNLSDEPL